MHKELVTKMIKKTIINVQIQILLEQLVMNGLNRQQKDSDWLGIGIPMRRTDHFTRSELNIEGL